LISTRSSVKEMVAPGAYAILTPLTVGFALGPRCLMGMLAGAIVSGAMLAIMMSNAGGAWDNSKKLCEKLKIKKTEQGKACIVGDTVGDPFKDTSGPALNILIKLMSMVALTIAPLLKEKVTVNGLKMDQGNDDWENWYLGMIPLALMIFITGVLMYKKILTWEDPLAGAAPANPPAGGSGGGGGGGGGGSGAGEVMPPPPQPVPEKAAPVPEPVAVPEPMPVAVVPEKPKKIIRSI